MKVGIPRSQISCDLSYTGYAIQECSELFSQAHYTPYSAFMIIDLFDAISIFSSCPGFQLYAFTMLTGIDKWYPFLFPDC